MKIDGLFLGTWIGLCFGLVFLTSGLAERFQWIARLASDHYRLYTAGLMILAGAIAYILTLRRQQGGGIDDEPATRFRTPDQARESFSAETRKQMK